MNRFDRVISILTLLHTKKVITAKEISQRFQVSERTIYRDIRTLETAGIPIGSEAGIGYYLDKSFRLPPIMFDQEEAVALLLAEKFIASIQDQKTNQAYKRALDKVKAVLESEQLEYVNRLADHIDVHTGIKVAETLLEEDQWLNPIQRAIVFSCQIRMKYFSHYRQAHSERTVDPIGLYHYSRHWHLIAWCHDRENYRDFRLDRIQALDVLQEHFRRHDHLTLADYLESLSSPNDLHQVVIHVRIDIATFMQNQKYYYGFIKEERLDEQWLAMTFLVSQFEYIGRWLLGYTDAVKIESPSTMKQTMLRLLDELNSVKSHLDSSV